MDLLFWHCPKPWKIPTLSRGHWAWWQSRRWWVETWRFLKGQGTESKTKPDPRFFLGAKRVQPAEIMTRLTERDWPIDLAAVESQIKRVAVYHEVSKEPDQRRWRRCVEKRLAQMGRLNGGRWLRKEEKEKEHVREEVYKEPVIHRWARGYNCDSRYGSWQTFTAADALYLVTRKREDTVYALRVSWNSKESWKSTTSNAATLFKTQMVLLYAIVWCLPYDKQ